MTYRTKIIIVFLCVLVFAAAVLAGGIIWWKQYKQNNWWNNYSFELEDISKEDSFKVENFPPTEKELEELRIREQDPYLFYDARVWKVSKNGAREVFIESVKKSAGVALNNTSFQKNFYGKIHQAGSKLYFDLYQPAGKIPPNYELWELDLSSRKFRPLAINGFLLGDIGVNRWSPDGTKLTDTEDIENHQVLRVLDVVKDDYEVIAELSYQKQFAVDVSEWCRKGFLEWIDNTRVKVGVYDGSGSVDKYGEECKPETDYLEEILLDIEKPISEVQVSKNEFSSWKVYQNKKYGFNWGGDIVYFEVDYPSSWFIEEGPILTTFSSYKERGQGCYLIIGAPGRGTFGYSILQKKEMLVAGNKKERFLLKNDEGTPTSDKFIFNIGADKDTKGIDFLGYIFEDDFENCLGTFDKMVSTFRFINSSESLNWKTYQNDKYGFEFQYPESWFINEYPNETPFLISISPSDYPGCYRDNTCAGYIHVFVEINSQGLSLESFLSRNYSVFYSINPAIMNEKLERIERISDDIEILRDSPFDWGGGSGAGLVRGAGGTLNANIRLKNLIITLVNNDLKINEGDIVFDKITQTFIR